MIRELTPELLRSDASAYLAWLATSPQVAGGKVGLTGYCMGARLAVLAAAMFPDRVGGGGRIPWWAARHRHSGQSAPDRRKYHRGAVFAHAGEDQHMTPEHIAQFDKALSAAGVRHRTEVYEGVQHGYTQADTSAYDPDAAERHYRELLALFDRNLRR
jgi:carboxymethylenebutenolidase